MPQFGQPLGTWVNEFELPCIFPFYYREKLYTSCALLDIGDYNTPVYRCPIFNTTKKKNGINHFVEDYRDDGNGDARGIRKYCLDQKLAKRTCGSNLEEELRKLPNSPCKLMIDASGTGTGLLPILILRGWVWFGSGRVLSLFLVDQLFFFPASCVHAKVEPFATCKSDCPGGEINSLFMKF